ncbi:uncharacterized protein yc1106_03555 [Curvularia clavata]|uniref:Cytochrome P450 n=1 Tax=Curvularia clavata TaxID=95742 RepID=A0A9Q9DSC1_CURCL|nr:uncharacterized protein yc1106_03555 [Curvularia clavata]
MSSTVSVLWIIPAVLAAFLHSYILYPFFYSPLSRIPGPKLYAFTKWRLAWDDWTGQRTRVIHALHQKYGPVVRIGPNEIHFNSLHALRTIYGAGSGFERTDFYRMFDAYGRKNIFTFGSGSEHAQRKRLVTRPYSKSGLSQYKVDYIVQEKIKDFLRLLEDHHDEKGLEIFTALHYYSIDMITTFLYGTSDFGATTALRGTPEHRALLGDIMDHARRRLSWFAVHLPPLTKWMYTRTGLMGTVVRPVLPMAKPATYTGIRAHALRAMHTFRDAGQASRARADKSIISELYAAQSKLNTNMDDLDIASECADHLLAGIDTTSDTLMFIIWCLSLPRNAHVQQKLVEECKAIPEDEIHEGAVNIRTADSMPYLNAIIKETLRLFAPLPSSEPRLSRADAVVDDYNIPRGTVCSMAPYSLHRNENVFPDSHDWKPERWLNQDKTKLTEMERWFWAFSSGARMCIGMQ